MKNRALVSIIISLFFYSCVSIPKETVTLSKVLGNDIAILHNSHRNIIELYYNKIKKDINNFIDDVYTPFIIHYVLKIELEKYNKGEESLYGILENAAKRDGKDVTIEALNAMSEFQEAANVQIQEKRNELLDPILKQEKETLNNIDKSYENVINANYAITGYLESIRKIKNSQNEVLSLVGLKGKDSLITNNLIKVSELVNMALAKGKKIDVKSDEAYRQIEDISKKIRELTN